MGLNIPELIVRDELEAGLELFLADPRVLTIMVEDLSADERDSILTALENRKGKVRLGWPMEPIEDWCLSVLLESTQPRQTLGQVTSDLEEGASTASATLAAAVTALPNVALALTAAAPAVPAHGVCRIGQEYATYAVSSGVVTLVARGIKGTAALPHDAGAAVLFPEFVQAVGYPETVFLRVDVAGTNPTFIVVLARMLKAYLTARGDLFDARGITLQQIVESDLAPRPPGLIPYFVRTLRLQCFLTMSVPELVPVVGGVEATLTTTTTEGIHGQPEFVTGD